MAFAPAARNNPLNPAQQTAVEYLGGPLLVLAGAGSGKTRVIARKIAYLIHDCGYHAAHIAAVTFTNKAAREMQARVGQLLGTEQTRGLIVCTFHTLGLRILQREHQAAGYKKNFSIFDAEDARALIADILKADNLDLAQTIEHMQWQIGQWKSAALGVAQALQSATDAQTQRAARVYAQYDRALRAYNAVDFDDLLLLPAQLLAEHPAILQRWREQLRYLLVDEYQDTNGTQYALLKLLAGPRAMFTVVGDDDQSIYAWRGARPENLQLLQNDFPHLNVVKLEQNYRSSNTILRCANTLIAHNPHIFEKRLWSRVGDGGPARVLSCRDAQHEVEQVVSDLVAQHVQRHNRWGDYAILFRGNHQARLFEKLLREHRVPYKLSGGTSFFERSEVRDILAYLRLIVNLDNDAALLRIVNVPRRELGTVTLEKLGEYAGQRHGSLYAALWELGLEQQLPDRTITRLREFGRLIGEFAERAAGDEAPAVLVRALLEETGYQDWLHATGRNAKSAAARFENVQELVQWLENLDKQQPGARNLAAMLAHMSLMDMLDRAGDDEAGDQVQLMTLHAAKGLEFPHVYLVGIEEDLLPHRNSIEAGSIEEERRLLYVGITRAQQSLTLSHAEKRRRYGEEIACEPSRFLGELPADALKWSGGQHTTPEEKIETGQNHLAGLRGLLTGS